MGYAHGKRWNETEVEEQIMQIVRDRGMTTFPTLSEMTEYYGNQGLRNKVARSGGSFAWAEKLGLPMKQSDTSFGRKYELFAIEDIRSHTSSAIVEKMSTRYPYDILVEKCVKIDVKASRPVRNGKGGYQYSFNLEKKYPTCDVFLLYGLGWDGEVLQTLIVPSLLTYGISQIYAGTNPRWMHFQDKWQVFSSYLKFYNGLREGDAPSHEKD